MRVLVTGGTGFTGRRVVRRLAGGGHEVRCLVRPASDRTVLDDVPVEFRVGRLEDPREVEAALSGSDALVHVASLGFGWGPGVVRATVAAGVRRAVFFSTTAVFTALPAPSRAVRVAAEEAIRNSGLEWTILRPTMIYGARGDRNVERLLRALRTWPAFPVAGKARRRVQPVHVDDLADAVVAVLERRGTFRRSYCLAGAESVGFGEFVRAAARAVGVRARLIPIPGRLLADLAGVWERIPLPPRIRREQVLRLLEDKDFDAGAARRDFGWDPAGVREGLEREAASLRAGAGG